MGCVNNFQPITLSAMYHYPWSQSANQLYQQSQHGKVIWLIKLSPWQLFYIIFISITLWCRMRQTFQNDENIISCELKQMEWPNEKYLHVYLFNLNQFKLLWIKVNHTINKNPVFIIQSRAKRTSISFTPITTNHAYTILIIFTQSIS